MAAAPLLSGPLCGFAQASGPMLGASQPKNMRFKLATFEITTISDSAAFIDGPWPSSARMPAMRRSIN